MPATPFPPPYADADELADHWWWRPGWEIGTRFYTWHVTVADLPALADHVAAYQEPLARLPFLDLIPREWLHITVQGVGHARAVDNLKRDAVVHAVSDRLASVPAPRLTFAQPVLHREAVVIPPTNAAPLAEIRHAIRAGIEASHGRAEGDPDTFRPHVSVAYVNASAEVAPTRAALNAVQADPVDVAITHVSLIELHRDNRMYQWTTVATVRLGAD